MANLIQLARYRSVARRDLPLDIPSGDADLRPIAVMLWAFSVLRVTLTLIHHQTFDVEATLALLCALFLPLLILSSRNARDTARQ
jgi:hypothetical protein